MEWSEAMGWSNGVVWFFWSGFLEWVFGVISEVLEGQKMTFLCLGIPDVNMPGVNAIKPH